MRPHVYESSTARFVSRLEGRSGRNPRLNYHVRDLVLLDGEGEGGRTGGHDDGELDRRAGDRAERVRGKQRVGARISRGDTGDGVGDASRAGNARTVFPPAESGRRIAADRRRECHRRAEIDRLIGRLLGENRRTGRGIDRQGRRRRGRTARTVGRHRGVAAGITGHDARDRVGRIRRARDVNAGFLPLICRRRAASRGHGE